MMGARGWGLGTFPHLFLQPLASIPCSLPQHGLLQPLAHNPSPIHYHSALGGS
jgi:hypothetical protein